ncbi:MAG: DUF1643 domain-containing protein [Rhodocyclaceae bacterium]|nr:DUF1643 domain-containing protein [Rhodocyclaceae bacterium]
MTSNLFGEHTGAIFSPCRRYRYRLWREWDSAKPKVCFVMMNPSTADEVNDDPTVAGCQIRIALWPGKYGGVIVVNVFAWRETDSKLLPRLIAAGEDIVGPENDQAILTAATDAGLVVCAWGVPGELGGRGRHVLKMLRDNGIVPHAFQLNQDGSPRHPLYIGHDVVPSPF